MSPTNCLVQRFFHVMSLQTGASLITLSLLLNKISGLYGLLALLTGYQLSSVQLSMYIYSLLALGLTAFLFPHIRSRSPLQCLALAWFYTLDSIINAIYTVAFGVTWFLVVSVHSENGPSFGPGSSGIEASTGFPGNKYNPPPVQDAVRPATGTAQGVATTNYLLNSTPGSFGLNAGTPSFGRGVVFPESIESIAIIASLWSVRVYFILVMLAFARQTLRQQLLNGPIPRYSQLPNHSRNASVASAADIDRDPFLSHTPEGQGWHGILGRFMISVGRNYWLGDEAEDVNWMNDLSRKFRSRSNVPNSGLTERERRRRSGTGPPLPSQTVIQGASLPQSGHGQPVSGMNVNLQDLNDGR